MAGEIPAAMNHELSLIEARLAMSRDASEE